SARLPRASPARSTATPARTAPLRRRPPSLTAGGRYSPVHSRPRSTSSTSLPGAPPGERDTDNRSCGIRRGSSRCYSGDALPGRTGSDEPSSVRVRPGRGRGGIGDGGGGAAARGSAVGVAADPRSGAGSRGAAVRAYADRAGAHGGRPGVPAGGRGGGERVAAGEGDGAG